MKASFLGKLLERVDQLEPEQLQRYLVRLAREHGYLETLFNTLQDAIVVLDGKGVIQYTNRAATRLLPFPRETASGQPVERYLRDVPWKEWLDEPQGVTRRLSIHYPEPKVVELVLLPMEVTEGAWEGMRVAIFHDITERESTAREAIESERMQALTLLAAGVAHELGNPINSLNIHLQLMQRDLRRLEPDVAAPLKESIGIARREIDRLDAIIQQFLRAIRPTVPDFQPLQLGLLIRETLETLDAEIRDRGVLVETDIASDLPDLLLDPVQVKQVIYNLSRNAFQAMGAQGLLNITVARQDEWVVVVFRDNGCGISVEDLPRVTEAYYTTKEGGSGLGLMIVQRIVREHGGEMEIESHPGRGTAVRLKFPAGGRQVRLLESTPDKARAEGRKGKNG
ncbi:MAG: ATP-binding protein [Candidatus Methylacidiphilales bacterium]|nr:ATP-binding protein [Candidatus Methylacidiphilales bacterium]